MSSIPAILHLGNTLAAMLVASALQNKLVSGTYVAVVPVAYYNSATGGSQIDRGRLYYEFQGKNAVINTNPAVPVLDESGGQTMHTLPATRLGRFMFWKDTVHIQFQGEKVREEWKVLDKGDRLSRPGSSIELHRIKPLKQQRISGTYRMRSKTLDASAGLATGSIPPGSAQIRFNSDGTFLGNGLSAIEAPQGIVVTGGIEQPLSGRYAIQGNMLTLTFAGGGKSFRVYAEGKDADSQSPSTLVIGDRDFRKTAD